MTKALIVVTNTAKFPTINRATGLWLSEATHFNKVMKDNNIDVDYVSPNGGYVPIDPGSLAPDSMDETNWSFYNEEKYRDQVLGQSLSAKQVDPKNYDIIYFAGGHGVMWDFPENKTLGEIAKTIYDRGGIVSAVCHGVVGLLSMKDNEGNSWINGKNLTGFTNEEEDINKLTDAVPFLTEEALKNAGANHTKTAAYTENVVADGRLVTGQNPQSAHGVGEAVIELLA